MITARKKAQKVVEAFFHHQLCYFPCEDEQELREVIEELNYIPSIGEFGLTGNYLYQSGRCFGKIEVLEGRHYGCLYFPLTSIEEEQYLNGQIRLILEQFQAKHLSDEQKIKYLHDYLINHILYVERKKKQQENITIEECIVHTAYGAAKGKAVCQGYALYYARLLNALNISCLVVNSQNHAWNIVRCEGKYYHVDVCWDSISDYQYQYFMKSDQEMMQGNGDHNLEKMFTNNKFYQYYPIAKQSLRLEK